MTHAKIHVNQRTLVGNEAKKLRKAGLIPAVIYGKTLPHNVNIEIPYNQFVKLYSQEGRTSVIEISVGDNKKTIPTLIQEVSLDPVTDKVVHIDFLAVNLKQKTIATVPLNFINEAPVVKQEGAVVSFILNEVDVEAFPDNLPDKVDVDLQALTNLDSVIHISDLATATNYVIINNTEEVVVSVTMPQEESSDDTQLNQEGDSDINNTTLEQ